MAGKIQRSSGAVLVLSIIVLIVLFVVVTQFTYTTKIEHKLAENSEDNLEVYYSARAVMEASKALLMEDDTPLIDSETDLWGEKYEHRAEMEAYAKTLGKVGLAFTVRDSGRYINLAGLWSPNEKIRTDTLALLTNFTKVCEASEQCGVDALDNRICDYVDADKTGEYEYEDNLNQKLATHEQLLDLPTVPFEAMDKIYYGYTKEETMWGGVAASGERVAGLKECTTEWGENTSYPPRININTACREVLASVILMNNAELDLDVALEEADKIILHRDDEEENAEDGTKTKTYFANFGKIKSNLEEIECPNAALASRWFQITAAPPGKSQYFIVTLFASKGTFKKEICIILERKAAAKPPNQVIIHMWREVPPHVPRKEKAASW
jgi:type II secretory pathway component PulK